MCVWVWKIWAYVSDSVYYIHCLGVESLLYCWLHFRRMVTHPSIRPHSRGIHTSSTCCFTMEHRPTKSPLWVPVQCYAAIYLYPAVSLPDAHHFHFYLQNGNSALSIARRLGYISVVDTLKVVTEETLTTYVCLCIFPHAFDSFKPRKNKKCNHEPAFLSDNLHIASEYLQNIMNCVDFIFCLSRHSYFPSTPH